MQNFQSPARSGKRAPAGRLNDSILESLRSIGTGVGKSLGSDVFGPASNDALQSIFGPAPKSPKNGELKPNQPVDLGQQEEERKPSFRRPEFLRPTPVNVEEAGIKQKIEAVRQELQALSKAVKQFNTEAIKAIETIPADPGIYHLNFLERLRGVLKLLREQVEDSNSWLKLHTTRKKKMGFWGMYKKHGTSFGLSNERTAATQAG